MIQSFVVALLFLTAASFAADSHSDEGKEANGEHECATTSGLVSVTRDLWKTTNLTKLSVIRIARLSTKEMEKLITGMLAQENLRSLELRDSHLDDDFAVLLAEFLERSSSLQNVELSSNGMSDKGGAAIAGALTKNKSINYLNLQDNKIGDETAIAIAAMLLVNNNLRVLFILANPIGEIGVKAIAESMSTNRSIIMLLIDDENGEASSSISNYAARNKWNNCQLEKCALVWPKLRVLLCANSDGNAHEDWESLPEELRQHLFAMLVVLMTQD